MPAKRVFVLGSGFSASMGLPTLVNLLDEIMADPEPPGENDKENVKPALAHLYPRYASYPPYEEFLSLMTYAQDFPFHDEYFWKKKITSSLRLLMHYLAEKSSEAEDEYLLISFCRRLEYGDVIITFNWDNLIERCLFNLGLNVDFEKRTTNAITVLKLHGNINMGLVSECGSELKNHAQQLQ